MKKLLVLSFLFVSFISVGFAQFSVVETKPKNVPSLKHMLNCHGMVVEAESLQVIDDIKRALLLVDHSEQQGAMLDHIVREQPLTKRFHTAKVTLSVEKYDTVEFYWHHRWEDGRNHVGYEMKWIKLFDDLEGEPSFLSSELARFKNAETRQEFLNDYDIVWDKKMRVSIIYWTYAPFLPKVHFSKTFDSFEVWLK